MTSKARSSKTSNTWISPISLVMLTIMWVLLWGDLSWGNVLAGLGLALLLLYGLPVPHGPKRRLVIRPIAFIRLMAIFMKDIVVSALHIAWLTISGGVPREAIIRVHTRAHSDGFLTATAGFTALVPGSIVIDAHRMTGTLYIHVFDVADDDQALDRAHQQVLDQEERILRALASDDELMAAGFRPGGSMKAGRFSESEMKQIKAQKAAQHLNAAACQQETKP